MKKTLLLYLGVVIILTIMILPASAAKTGSFHANGKDFWYYGFDPNNPGSSMIVGGNYDMLVKNYNAVSHTGDASFHLFYKELNLISEGEGGAPVGSVDQFRITLVETYWIDMNPEWYLGDDTDPKCNIEGKFLVEKLAWLPEGVTPRVAHKGYEYYGFIYGYAWVCPGNLEFEASAWHLWGPPPTTINMR